VLFEKQRSSALIYVYSVRGTNGSGKSTLARAFIGGDPAAPPNRPGDENSPNMVDLARYSSPTKADPGRFKAVEGYVSTQEDATAIVVGSYRTACGGLDAVPSFDLSFQAIRRAADILGSVDVEHKAVIAEGVISSTVWGSWGDFAAELAGSVGVRMAFCYLDTPLEVCLQRIRERQRAAGKERQIKEELVCNKILAVRATKRRALEAGHLVYDLPYLIADTALFAIIHDLRRAREMYLARA
jgi:predicted ABC-type ATPase